MRPILAGGPLAQPRPIFYSLPQRRCYARRGVDRPASRHAGPALPASTSPLVQHGCAAMAEGVGYATSARSLPKRHSRTAPSGFLTIIRSSNPFWRAKLSPLRNKAGRRVRLGIGEMRTLNDHCRRIVYRWSVRSTHIRHIGSTDGRNFQSNRDRGTHTGCGLFGIPINVTLGQCCDHHVMIRDEDLHARPIPN